MKKLAAAIIAAASIALALTFVSGAVTVSELESRYGLEIVDDTGLLSDGGGYCDMMDTAFAAYGADLLSAVEKHFDDEGLPTVIYFTDAIDDVTDGDITEDYDGVTINLYYTDRFDDGETVVETLAHELGHYVHYMLDEIAGESALEKEWLALNSPGFSYNPNNYDKVWRKYNEAAFAYNYGMSDYYEDVATICEYLVARPNDMSGRLSDGEHKILRSKVELYKSWIDEYIGVKSASLFAPLGASSYVPAKPAVKASAWALDELYEGQSYGLYRLPTDADLRATSTRRDFCEILAGMTVNYYEMTEEEIFDFYGEDPSDYDFSDLKPSDSAIRFCCMMGFVSGAGNGLFAPDRVLTRQEAAVILLNVRDYLELPETGKTVVVADISSVAPWARDYVRRAVTEGIMVGDDAKRFNPTGNYSLEQAYLTLKRLFIAADDYYIYDAA